ARKPRHNRLLGAPSATGRLTRLRVNFRHRDDGTINIALDETTDDQDIAAILVAFTDGAAGPKGSALQTSDTGAPKAPAAGHPPSLADTRPSFGETHLAPTYPPGLARTTGFLAHPVFNTHHSETQMMRY